ILRQLPGVTQGRPTRRRTQAEKERLRAERLVYSGQITLAQQEWQDNEVAHARDLLDACRWDMRGWEHAYLRAAAPVLEKARPKRKAGGTRQFFWLHPPQLATDSTFHAESLRGCGLIFAAPSTSRTSYAGCSACAR